MVKVTEYSLATLTIIENDIAVDEIKLSHSARTCLISLIRGVYQRSQKNSQKLEILIILIPMLLLLLLSLSAATAHRVLMASDVKFHISILQIRLHPSLENQNKSSKKTKQFFSWFKISTNISPRYIFRGRKMVIIIALYYSTSSREEKLLLSHKSWLVML